MDDPISPPLPDAGTPPSFGSNSTTASGDASLRVAEIVSLLLIVLLADVAIYRGEGYAGWAALAAAAPILLFLGTARRSPDRSLPVLGLMLALIAGKLLWCGSLLAAVSSVALLSLFAMSLAGRRPYLLDAVSFSAALVYYGGRGVSAYGRHALRFGRRFVLSNAIVYVLPAVVGLAFSLLFVLANPDLVESLSETLWRALERIRKWLSEISFGESLFLLGTAWIAVGLLRPGMGPANQSPDGAPGELACGGTASETASGLLFLAWRNTLVMVILIYAIYLGFEFHTLWFRVFPKGFSYSGYAHEGAAWLTVGLALATSILSLIFRGRILRAGGVKRLERLAWVWSLENLLLAAAVYHRLFIYVAFNGLTRMRIVGLYGVFAVLIGFLLVLLKIVRRRDFAWLLQRHLWTLAMAVFLYAITPADLLAMRYNVACIRSGNSAPLVQIVVQPISAEGLLVLPPLLGDSDPVVRDGVAVLLERRWNELRSKEETPRHWTAWQLAEVRFLNQFKPAPAEVLGATGRTEAWDRFQRYAYQWY